MRETFDPWTFIVAAYLLGAGGTLLMVGWSWLAMLRAEDRRERSRRP